MSFEFSQRSTIWNLTSTPPSQILLAPKQAQAIYIAEGSGPASNSERARHSSCLWKKGIESRSLVQ
ncbi:hypothetical protein M413DRAFT_437877 [Hebeloma cylindrosporum]|uniref:Uncharacterized protein n=1 Tax=Hebeloma cylindrosporum TaxID=76867 RepID=A0A0C3CX23_HEBCY|nr:hypothetical protein M413DRAFT_437877 [Hebeloma cylindrosporum h7]